MPEAKAPFYAFAILIVLVLSTQTVLAYNYGTVQITNINAPATVAAGESITISITVQYDLTQPMSPEGLLIALMPHTETGNPYPITAMSSNCEQGTVSVCFTNATAQFFGGASITVFFTLNAPTTPETWRPVALAIIYLWSLTSPSSFTPETTTYQATTIDVT